MLHRDRKLTALFAAEPRGGGGGGRRRRLELIDYEEDLPLVDHKGRSRPMYKASSPKPASWRPSRFTRLLLGTFPGVRTMALFNAKSGLLYLLLGIGAAVSAVLLFDAWSRSYLTFENLAMEPRWLLLHVAALLGAIFLFEILRLLSAIDESLRGPVAPRALAALLIPSLAVLYAAPKVVTFWPRLVESSFCAALVIVAGALPAAIWSIGMAFVRAPDSERRLGWACATLAAFSVGGLAAAAMSMPPDVWSTLRAQGFEVLPALFG